MAYARVLHNTRHHLFRTGRLKKAWCRHSLNKSPKVKYIFHNLFKSAYHIMKSLLRVNCAHFVTNCNTHLNFKVIQGQSRITDRRSNCFLYGWELRHLRVPAYSFGFDPRLRHTKDVKTGRITLLRFLKHFCAWHKWVRQPTGRLGVSIMVWMIPFCSPVAEFSRLLGTQKLSSVHRSDQTKQVQLNSPHLHAHTPANTTKSNFQSVIWFWEVENRL